MAITYVGAVSADSGTTNSAASHGLVFPVGTLAGDIIIGGGQWSGAAVAITCTGDGSATMQTAHSSGDGTLTGNAFHKTLTPTDIGNTGVLVSGTGARSAAGLIVLRGASGVELVTSTFDDANDTSQPIPANDPTNNSVFVAVVAVNGAQTLTGCTAPAGWTERVDEVGNAATGRQAAIWIGTFDTFGGAVSAATLVSNQNAHSAAWVYAVNAVPDPTEPDAPTDATAEAGDEEASVSWTASASDGGSAISGYTVTGDPDGTASVGGGATSALVTGLTNDVEYTFTVHATNAVGDSDESDPSDAVTPTGGLPPAGDPGAYGDTLVTSMNRLAGTTGLSDQSAANVWAETPAGTSLVAALNIKAGNSLPNYRELAGVLNQLAGTVGLEVDGAAAAIVG